MTERISLVVLFLILTSCVRQHSDWRDVQVDSTDLYNIASENKIHLSDFEEPNDTIRASIEVSNEKNVFSSVLLSSALVVNDTLKIDLYTTNSAYHHEYRIIVAGGKYSIKYRFAASPGYVDGILVPLETKLKLNTSEIKKGMIVRGYTEFKANCIEPCGNGFFVARGNFKAIVK